MLASFSQLFEIGHDAGEPSSTGRSSAESEDDVYKCKETANACTRKGEADERGDRLNLRGAVHLELIRLEQLREEPLKVVHHIARLVLHSKRRKRGKDAGKDVQ